MKVSTSLGHCKVSNARNTTLTLAAYNCSQYLCFSQELHEIRAVVHWLVESIQLEQVVQTALGYRGPK